MKIVINSAQSVYEVARRKETGVHKGFTKVSTDYDDDDNDDKVEDDD